MVDARQQFGTRVKSLESKNVKLARGYYTTIRADGLVVARPARRGRAARFQNYGRGPHHGSGRCAFQNSLKPKLIQNNTLSLKKIPSLYSSITN